MATSQFGPQVASNHPGMNPALVSAASGMVARSESLEALANNLANSSTIGYKADRDFYQAFRSAFAQPPVDGGPAQAPYLAGAEIDFRQGAFRATGSALHVALRGPGFLVVQGDAGPLYTRSGELHLAADGTLLGPAGLPLADEDGEPIVVPPVGPASIDAEGIVRAGLTVAGRLAVVEFGSPPPLAKAGGQLLRPLSDAPPAPAGETTLEPGYLEESNVEAAASFARLLSVQRHFEMLRRTATLAADELDGRAVETLARTS